MKERFCLATHDCVTCNKSFSKSHKCDRGDGMSQQVDNTALYLKNNMRARMCGILLDSPVWLYARRTR